MSRQGDCAVQHIQEDRESVVSHEEDQEDLGGSCEDQLEQLLELFSEGSIGP